MNLIFKLFKLLKLSNYDIFCKYMTSIFYMYVQRMLSRQIDREYSLKDFFG